MTTKVRIFLSVLFFQIVFYSTNRCDATNDYIVDIRQRVLELVIWPSEQAIPGVVQSALKFSTSMNRTCFWEDINYDDRSLANWATEEHLTRVNTMVQALTVPGSTLQNNSQLATATHCALNVWLTRDWINPNWWFNQIGVPLLVSGQLLMLAENATDFEIQKITNISYRADWWYKDPGTGANLIWMIQVELYRSLATHNLTGVQEGFSRMWKDIAVLPLGGQGIQTDWSYHFHGTQILSAAYGQDWLVAMMIFVLCSQDTPYQPIQDQLIILGKFIAEGDAWMIIDNIWDWHVYGRAIDRPELILTVDFSSDWIRSLAGLTESDQLRKDLMNFADRIDKKPDATQLIGNRHFYTSDYQVHRRQNWTSMIKMQSLRTQPTECINGENQKGEHLGQGVLNLYTTDPTDYRHIFPILDWQSINGITVEHDIPVEPCTHGCFDWSPTSFVGGVSDGDYGLAMMDTATHNLTAKRSWHFYDQAVYALASRLTLSTSNNARTSLCSRISSKGVIQVGFFNGTIISLVDGITYSFPYGSDAAKNVQWIHLSESNIGYLLQTQKKYASIGVETSQKTGTFESIGPYNDSVTIRTVDIWIDHGLGPFLQDYSYMIIPSKAIDEFLTLINDFESDSLFSCVSNNDTFHAVSWPSLQRSSFVNWNNSAVYYSCQSSSYTTKVILYSDGAYLINETSSSFSITASHPSRVNESLKVNINRSGQGINCERLPDGTTDVTIDLPSSPQYLGQSVTVTCQK